MNMNRKRLVLFGAIGGMLLFIVILIASLTNDNQILN